MAICGPYSSLDMGVLMVDLSMFSTSSLQTSLALLSMLRGSGVEGIEDAINLVSLSITHDAGRIITPPEESPLCPSCGLGVMGYCQAASRLVGTSVRVCSRHCGYTEVV